jgi:hypothetical protein
MAPFHYTLVVQEVFTVGVGEKLLQMDLNFGMHSGYNYR